MGDKMLVFDTETTGVDVFNDRIVQLFIGLYEDGEPLETWEWVIDPGVEVPEGASNVHGFTTEFLQEHGMDPKEALLQAYDVFDRHSDVLWVAYNLNFDLTILDAEFKRYGISKNFGDSAALGNLLDPLVVDRAKDRYRKGKRTLEAVAPVYGVGFNAEAAHKADYDVSVTAKVAAAVVEQYGLPTNEEQGAWYADWAEGLEGYLRKKDPTARVDRGWPLKHQND